MITNNISHNGSEGIVERRMLFCPNLSRLETNELITTCPNCRRFAVLCCQHAEIWDHCHHFKLMFTDGSCLDNGQLGATAGIGIACGDIGIDQDQWAIPVTIAIDTSPKRSSQRAELLAALEAIRIMNGLGPYDSDDEDEQVTGSHNCDRTIKWVIATDSEYVVRGITEWVPTWKQNNWRTIQGSRPSNLDLFKRLDAAVEELERMHDIVVGFWHISRNYNNLADSLARRAAREARAGETL